MDDTTRSIIRNVKGPGMPRSFPRLADFATNSTRVQFARTTSWFFSNPSARPAASDKLQSFWGSVDDGKLASALSYLVGQCGQTVAISCGEGRVGMSRMGVR
jgi:hypothetical protein